MVRGNEMRDQCQRERDDQAQRIVDLEMGLAEQARLLGEERRAREAAEARHELDMANLRHWLKEQYEEKTSGGLRDLVRRLGRLGA